MPKRNDLKSILLIGSGPIVIGQACEFDYSGTQAIKALKEEGYRVILINSNPATIMTDPELADRTYIEPITAEYVERVIAAERPSAVLPTMGGQTALNIAIELAEKGVFEKYDTELIGAKIPAIRMAEDRDLFKTAMTEIGLNSAKSFVVRSVAEAQELKAEIGLPMILRPSRTLGGSGGGIVRDDNELVTKVTQALNASPNHEVLIEESMLGWKEYELEVMRDLKDNVVIICSIENLDPMGIHTGDSITVAPIQTLTDKEYQVLRDASIKIIRKIGVETGGSNVQFAINPEDGRMIVIEMNPRVSRSSALASKATGFPIAKIAAKLAVGYTLDEIPNDITRETPASFEPSIDYVVVKIPRFNFEKFPYSDDSLGTQMKSVGEVMAFGSSFREALQKAICSLEDNSAGLDQFLPAELTEKQDILDKLSLLKRDRLWMLADALRRGISVSEIYKASKVDRWYLTELEKLVQSEQQIISAGLANADYSLLLSAKRAGFSNIRLAQLLETTKTKVAEKLAELEIAPAFKAVDTCAAEFKADTPYLYSTYQTESDAPPTDNEKKVIILGSGPNRIGQGIEFDYCCVHAVQALRANGFETIMVNCNPETVSTDYDTADRLYFEPLTFESVMSIIKREQPLGVILQFGGQTPLKLAAELEAAGVKILGTPLSAIDLSEDRKLFNELITKLNLKQPEGSTAGSIDEAYAIAEKIGYPLMLRPSFVLGGRSMKVVHDHAELKSYVEESVRVTADKPLLLDRYLHNAIEVDVDVVSDGETVIVASILEHIERAGVHSGDSACCLPPFTLSDEVVQRLKENSRILARELSVVGLMNVQYAVDKNDEIYIIEANPRASRTVPFVSKATGVAWAKIAALTIIGKKLDDLGISEPKFIDYFAVKECVFPFAKFPGADHVLGPEMKSTGEVMGIDSSFAAAFAKGAIAAGNKLPTSGAAFLSLMELDKPSLSEVANNLRSAGFKLIATAGTATYLEGRGFEVETVNKVREGSPHVVDYLSEGKIDLVINTPEGSQPLLDSKSIRIVASENKIPTFTTIAAGLAVSQAILAEQAGETKNVRFVKDYYRN